MTYSAASRTVVADTLFEWQRDLLRKMGFSEAHIDWCEDLLEDHMPPDMTMQSFAAGPDMISDVPIPARPGPAWNSVEVVWGKRAYKQLAVQVIGLLMEACGWDVKVLTRKDLSDG